MTLYGAMSIGVTGLESQSNKIGVISDNLANINTIGYKEGVSNFANLIENDTAASYSPDGVENQIINLNDVQGPITATSSPTDIAINGSGFFPVSSTTPADSNILYTRAGSFTTDANGNLVNGAGFYLQAWALNPDGTLPAALTGASVTSGAGIAALQTVNIPQGDSNPVPTTTASIKANLNASQVAYNTFDVGIQANLQSTQTPYVGPPTYDPTNSAQDMAGGVVAPQFTVPINVTDSTGVAQTLTAGFLNTGANTWAVEVYAQPPSSITNTGGQIAAGTMTFNSDGSLASVSSSLTQAVTVDWQDSAAPSTLNINWGTAGALGVGQTNGVSQLNAPYALTAVNTQTYNPAVAADNMASGAVSPQFNENITVVDSKGDNENITAGFLKTGTNTWAVELYAPASEVTEPNGQIASGTVTFNTDGSLASVSPALTQPTINWTNGAAPSTIAINWGTAGPPFGTPGATVIGGTDGLSQFSGAYTASIQQNGLQSAALSSVSVTGDGFIVANYSNGSAVDFYKIPLAQFTESEQLQSLSGNVFETTPDAGTLTFTQPGTGGDATLKDSALESSNVDQATQLTDMIVAQQAYQFSTKLVSTTDTMLSDLVAMGAT